MLREMWIFHRYNAGTKQIRQSLSPSETIAKFQSKHIVTLLGVTRCAHFATLFRRVATDWVLFAQI